MIMHFVMRSLRFLGKALLKSDQIRFWCRGRQNAHKIFPFLVSASLKRQEVWRVSVNLSLRIRIMHL
jgi:hypothetical protein